MMKRHASLVLAFAALAITVGCSQSSSGGGDGDAIANAMAAEELQGSWQSSCRDAELFGLTESSRLDVAGTVATQVTTTSSTGACG
ncbi:MAG: hypothetical protein V4760_14345, partial [Bdellovibrionota bacterium]